MRALVTGAAGFIGRHFVRRLAADGYNVDVLDVRGIPRVAGYDGPGDCRLFFRASAEGLIVDRPYDLVVHAAAIVGGRLTIENEPLAVASDLAIDSDLFQWAVRTKPGRVLYFSSSAAYPVHFQSPSKLYGAPRRLVETDIGPGPYIGRPDLSYGWVKLTGEYLAEMARAKGVPVTVVRPFSGYGSDQDDTYPFPAIIRRALLRDQPLTVWGSLDTVRDWIHVDDIVEACFRIMDRGTEEPVNLGTGRATSFAQLARKAADAVGYDCDIVADTTKPAGVAYRVADTVRLSGFYTPTVGLEEGIRRAVEELSR